MRVLYVAGREADYSRTRNVRKGLQKAGLDVVGVFPPRRSFRYLPLLIRRALLAARKADAIVVGFYGQPLVPFLRLSRKPLIFDIYISTFDTLILDRGLAGESSLFARVSRALDRVACAASDRIVLETNDHIRDFASKFAVPAEKFRRVFLAADEDVIYPRPVQRQDGRFWVHFHGEYAPFHGVNHIIEAAKILQDQGVCFRLIGTGITSERDRGRARQLGLRNVEFIDRVPYDSLAEYMSRADVCLGFFGENRRAERVFTNKVVESMGAGRPLVTRRNRPVQELLVHRENAFLCEPGSGEALAEAILELKEDPALREKLARNARRTFLENCTTEQLGKSFRTIIEELVENG